MEVLRVPRAATESIRSNPKAMEKTRLEKDIERRQGGMAATILGAENLDMPDAATVADGTCLTLREIWWSAIGPSDERGQISISNVHLIEQLVDRAGVLDDVERKAARVEDIGEPGEADQAID
jgi:hypothetical protein